ncbi:MAG: GldG family protein, partial [Longimicrobiales bacterium]
WDVTGNQVYRLSNETREVLRRLDAPVRILLFVEDADLPAYRDLLDEYAAASRLVSVEQVDVEAEPARARQYDVQEYGTSVVEYRGRFELTRGPGEQEFTNALMRLREGRTRKVYFTTGHAERDIASTERVGYSGIVAALRRDNFVVETVNFTQQADIPSDATLVVVAGPRADFFTGEINALRRYRAKGGAMLFLVDPFEDLKRYITESGLALFMMDPDSVSGSGELRNLAAFIREEGAELGNDVVVDTSEMGQFIGTDASVPVAASYPSHAITRGLTSLSAYPMARSVKPVPADGTTASAFIETSDRTWSETDIRQLGAGQLSMDQADGDRPGPVSLGVAVEAPPPSTRAGQAPARQLRMVAVGDSDVAANYSSNIPGNAEMFLSIVRWLAQEKVAVIPSRLPQERALTMTAWQHRLISWVALLLLPGIAVGVAAHLRKRA